MKGLFALPLLPDEIDFLVNSILEGTVQNTAPTGVNLVDTDDNPLTPVSINQIGNIFEIKVSSGSPVPAQIQINGVNFKTVDPADTLNILVRNSDDVDVGTPDSLNNRVNIADSSISIRKSDGTQIALIDIPAEDLDLYNVADSTITNDATTPTYTANVKATENLVLPAQQINVNSVNEGDINSVGAIDINITDGVDPVTPDAVSVSGRTVTVEVPSGDTPVVATGGTETTETIAGQQYKIHTFTSSGTFSVTQEGSIDFLLAAGGGGGRDGGGAGQGGGGGAGGVNFVNDVLIENGTYNVVIGGGGAANANGNNSIFGKFLSWGGGAGGIGDIEPENGGSGGGAASRATSPNSLGGIAIGFEGYQGFKGGDRLVDITTLGGAGGGGATSAGSDITNTGGGVGFAGGAGLTINFDGTIKTYSQGGQGGTIDETGASAGANTGSGGQGGGSSNLAGGTGGSGILIIRYKI